MEFTERFIPVWRRPKTKRRADVPYSTVGLTSGLAVLCLYFPSLLPGGLRVPISFQIAHREWHAMLLLFSLGLAIGIISVELLRTEYWPSAIILLADLGVLAYISMSDPMSMEHLFAYVMSAAITAFWLLLVSLSLDDAWMTRLAYGAILGVGLSLMFMGIGERILVTCCLGGVNLLYYRYSS